MWPMLLAAATGLSTGFGLSPASCLLPHIGGGPDIVEHDIEVGHYRAALLQAPVQKQNNELIAAAPSRREVLAAAATAATVVGAAPAANAASGAAVDLLVTIGQLSTQARTLQLNVREAVPSARARDAVVRARPRLQQLLTAMSAAAPDLRICAPELASCDCAPDPKRMALAVRQAEVVGEQLRVLDAALKEPAASFPADAVERALEQICDAADLYLDLAAGRPVTGATTSEVPRAPAALMPLAASRVGRRAMVPRLCASAAVPEAAARQTAPRARAPEMRSQQRGQKRGQQRGQQRGQKRGAPPPAECVDKLDRGLLRACALSWAAVAIPLLLDPSAVALDVFGLDVSGTFGVEQPAAGFFQLAATLMPLESVLLLALASANLNVGEARSVSAAVALAGAGIIGTCTAAAATGLTVTDPYAGASVLALSAVSAATAMRPLLRERSVSELAELYAEDARTLLGGGEGGGSLATFYRGSAIASVVVGAAFALSPVSPLAVYEAELPVTYLGRAAFGVYLGGLLAPVQFALYQSAASARLGAQSPRLLNVACAAAIVLLDGCGNAQVRVQEALVSGVEGLPDTFRFEANTTAAFYSALLVAIVYLVQGLRTDQEREVV